MQKAEISTFNGKIMKQKWNIEFLWTPHDKYKFVMKS
jgi:hypothetical protein